MAKTIYIYLTWNNLKRKLVCVFVILMSINIGYSAEDIKNRTFRKSPQYSNLKPVERSSFELTVFSRLECARKCHNDVTCKAFLFSNDVMLCSLYNSSFDSFSFVAHNGTQAYEPVLSDCYDTMMNGDSTSGVYRVEPRDNGEPIYVFCEITSTDGGWLVIQRRTDGSEDFYRTWNEYRDGFGDLNNEFWLGNTNIHRLTSQGDYDLRIDLEDFENNTAYALYKSFSLASEEDYFQLKIGQYSGDAGDSLGKHSGYKFSTKDRDSDVYEKNCAVEYKGAWWYSRCHASNLNGQYLKGNHSTYADGVNWRTWRGYYYSLKTSVMKIRPNF